MSTMSTQPEKEMFGGDETLPEPISKTINMIVEKAKENFLRDGELQPAAFMIDKEGQTTVIGLQLPPANNSKGRDAIGDLLRDTARKTMPVAVMFLSETWMTDTKKLKNWLNNIAFSPDNFTDTSEINKFMVAMDLNPAEFECPKAQAVIAVGELMCWLLKYLTLPEKSHKETGDLLMNMQDCYYTLYGSMSRMPGVVEACYFSLETLWGDYIKKLSITREGDKATLDENTATTGWTKQLENCKASGRFSNLLIKTPTSDDV